MGVPDPTAVTMPGFASRPLPRPLAALVGVTLITAVLGAGLAGCGEKRSGGAVETASASTPATPAPIPAGADGQQAYQRCTVCHQATGQGVSGAFPPLAGSEWATAANAALPIRIVLKGLQGAITVKGARYNGAMPAFGTGQPMNDADVAAVLTYVRSSWGNKASAVTAPALFPHELRT